TTHVERVPLRKGDSDAAAQEAARAAYKAFVARREQEERAAVLAAFGFTRSPFIEANAPTGLDGELFSRRVYQMLGLDKAKLVAYGAVAGATAGLGVDAALGGHSLGLGALAGAA